MTHVTITHANGSQVGINATEHEDYKWLLEYDAVEVALNAWLLDDTTSSRAWTVPDAEGSMIVLAFIGADQKIAFAFWDSVIDRGHHGSLYALSDLTWHVDATRTVQSIAFDVEGTIVALDGVQLDGDLGDHFFTAEQAMQLATAAAAAHGTTVLQDASESLIIPTAAAVDGATAGTWSPSGEAVDGTAIYSDFNPPYRRTALPPGESRPRVDPAHPGRPHGSVSR
jgi:hypothetical protein